MKTTTVNPWYAPMNSYSRKMFEYYEKPIATYRGVAVFKNYSGSFDYTIGGMTIAQRGKADAFAMQSVIEDLLDGKTPCAKAVCEYLRGLSYSPMSYDEYTKLWIKGDIA